MNRLLGLIIGFFLTASQLSAQKYFLKEKDSEASCTSFSIVDENGDEVGLTAEIKGALECPNVLDLDGNMLITYVNNTLVWYNISSQQSSSLVKLYGDIDGVSGVIRSPNGKLMMFVVVNQNKLHGYKEFCRIIVLGVDTSGKVLSKQKFDKPVNFSCGSICSSVAGVDFKFRDDNTIEYRRHELIEDRPGEWETIRLK